MKVTLLFVPPGGGETDYALDFELPAVPRPGDYICVTRPEQMGSEDFIVRRTWWHLNYPKGQQDHSHSSAVGSLAEMMVECEFAKSGFSSESHKQACEAYQHRTGKLLQLDASGY